MGLGVDVSHGGTALDGTCGLSGGGSGNPWPFVDDTVAGESVDIVYYVIVIVFRNLTSKQ